MKTDKKIKKFEDMETKEYKFHQNESHILINDIDNNKKVVFNMVPFGKEDFKYFTGCKDAKKIRPLCIFCPEMSIYRRDINKPKYMYFMENKEKVFDKYK